MISKEIYDLFELGHKAFQEKRYDEAINNLEKIIDIYNKDLVFYYDNEYIIYSNDDDNETPRLKTKSEGNIDYGWTGNPGGTPIGGGYDTGQGLTGGGGGGSKEDDDLEWEAQTHTFWKEYFHLRNLYADVSLGYKYNPKTKKAIEKGNIEISLDKYGLSLSLSWQDRCSAFDIVDEGENLRVLISGRIKSEVAIDGLVGSDLVVESFYKKVEYKVEPGHTDDYLKEDTE